MAISSIKYTQPTCGGPAVHVLCPACVLGERSTGPSVALALAPNIAPMFVPCPLALLFGCPCSPAGLSGHLRDPLLPAGRDGGLCDSHGEGLRLEPGPGRAASGCGPAHREPAAAPRRPALHHCCAPAGRLSPSHGGAVRLEETKRVFIGGALSFRLPGEASAG